MKNALTFISIVSLIALSSCAAMSQKHKAGKDEYYEDLSVVRPVFINPDTLTGNKSATPKNTGPLTFPNDVSKIVNARADSISELNKKSTTVQGFRILIYTGSSSDESQKVKQLVYSFDSDLNVYTQYKQPSFRVKVGDFTNRVEANYILNDLKKNFPNAMIVPDQINLLR
jgi:hypothetical protein